MRAAPGGENCTITRAGNLLLQYRYLAGVVGDVLYDPVQKDVKRLRLGCGSGLVQPLLRERKNRLFQPPFFFIQVCEGAFPGARHGGPILFRRVIAHRGCGQSLARNSNPRRYMQRQFPDAVRARYCVGSRPFLADIRENFF